MFKAIMVPIDVDEPSSWERALPLAARMAKASAAELHVLNVLPNFGMAIVGTFFPENFEESALKKAKEAYPNVQVIIMTGHGSEKDEEEARRLGAFEYLQKPVDINLLMETIRRAGQVAADED